jgi:hypothetical protein
VYAAWVAGSDRKASEMLRAADGIALRILRDCAGRLDDLAKLAAG